MGTTPSSAKPLNSVTPPSMIELDKMDNIDENTRSTSTKSPVIYIWPIKRYCLKFLQEQ